MLVSSSSYTSASAAARSAPTSVSTASVISAASTTCSFAAGSAPPVPVRLTAALTRSNRAAEAARARPTTGCRTRRTDGGTTSVTCSP
ncbi:hypothetical protein SPURM210S_07787 [Streptomyces purpurascens]